MNKVQPIEIAEWFMKQDIVDGIRDYNSEKVEAEKPLELVVKELGL